MLTLSIYHKSNVILVPKLCINPLETIFHRSKKFYLKTLKSISENYFVLFIIFQQIFLLPRSWMMPNPTGLVLLIYQKYLTRLKNICDWPGAAGGGGTAACGRVRVSWQTASWITWSFPWASSFSLAAPGRSQDTSLRAQMSNIIQQPQILYFKYLFRSVYLCSRPSRPSLWGRSSCRGAATCWPPPPRGTGCWRWRHCSRSSSCRPPRPRADQSEEAIRSRDLVSTNHSSPGVCGRGSASHSPWLSAPAARWNLGNKLYINIDIITICELHIDLLTEKVLLIKGKRNFFATLMPAAISHWSGVGRKSTSLNHEIFSSSGQILI